MKAKDANKFDPNRSTIRKWFHSGEDVGSGKVIRTKSGKVRIVSKRQYAHMSKEMAH